jgi:asparagine synthase (glutamine-hydrolysing)
LSGIAAVYDLQRPAGNQAIERLTGALRAFGPDRQRTWSDGPVALGHTLLETTPEDAHDNQPLTLDGRCWIVADARIDARDELIGKLQEKAETDLHALPDSALILHAWMAWKERCVEFLLGDFAFIIWDAQRQVLFCARDHFGVRPLFYARAGNRLLFSSAVAPLRQQVDTSALNELAIADFLLFAYGKDETTTTFEAIRRLPPAHFARIDAGGITVKGYWNLPFEEPLRYKDPREYVDSFREVLDVAVRDRVRTPAGKPVSIFLSGGLDSSAIAASAVKQNAKLTAFTYSFEHLIRHEEPHYSRLVAQRLGLPQEIVPGGRRAFDRFAEPGFLPDEPVNEPFLAATRDLHRRIAQTSRIVLTGNVGDEVLRKGSHYARYALRNGRSFELLRDSIWFIAAKRSLPRLGLRSALQRNLGMPLPGKWLPQMPSWIRPEFIQRLDLAERWRTIFFHSLDHPLNPDACDAVFANRYSHRMQEFVPDLSGAPLEFRHPFLDLRLIRYCLRLPAFPYTVDKEVVRRAFRDELPREIITRPKTGMFEDNLAGSLRHAPLVLALSSEVCNWVDSKKLKEALASAESQMTTWFHIRPIVLDYFLDSYKLNQKEKKTA